VGIGKTNIKLFCLQYTANSTIKLRGMIQSIEKDISKMEVDLINRYDHNLFNNLQEKKENWGFI